MPWALMILLTLVQIIGNVFSSYKYLMQHNVADLHFFKEPIFVWTDLPDNVTTVLVTYIVGAILPIVALCMTSMIANYLEDNKKEKEENTEEVVEEVFEQPAVEEPENEIPKDEYGESDVADEETKEAEESKPEQQSHFVNI